ncbi:flagellar motor switch protein FliN [Paraburkholderia phenazinium]|nr:flagellar motor switch protein FliN [Paraburkholderia phenazinium]
MRVDLPEQQPSLDDKDTVRPMLELLDDVKVKVDIHLGCAELSLKELMALQTGAVVELDRHLGDAIDVLLNNRKIAQAEIVAVGEQFGIRITDLPAKR